MSCTFGKMFTVTIFGESHSGGIGAVLDGLPPGTPLDLEKIRQAMARRAPSGSVASTARREADEPEILSGYLDGRTTGTPLAVLIRNKDTRSQDYQRTASLMRPGHADYAGFVKYGGANDIRGGGHFSGRLTAPLVFAGAAARQVLEARGIRIGAHARRIGDVEDGAFSSFTEEELLLPERAAFPVLDASAGERMLAAVDAAKREEDSLGGIIECAATGVPAGLGEPFFDSCESELAHMMFSVPAVKAIGFGEGFGCAGMKGSQMNDSPRIVDGRVAFATNHGGGINGGITNGAPVRFDVAIRPTASISQPQGTINVETWENDTLRLKGRHDACIVPRAVEVVKSATAVVLLDLLLREGAMSYAKQ